MRLFGSHLAAGILFLMGPYPAYAEGNYRFIYTVPTSPELARFATFELRGAALDTGEDKTRTLSFELPRELVGNQRIQAVLKEVPEARGPEAQFEGELGSATCRTTDERAEQSQSSATVVTCDVRYTLQSTYSTKVGFYLLTRHPLHYYARRRVALAFSSDPIGIVRIEPVP